MPILRRRPAITPIEQLMRISTTRFRLLPPILTTILLLTLGNPGVAAQRATADDGTRVLLKDDGTWETLDASALGDDKPMARLNVRKYQSQPGRCILGVTLQNDLGTPIRDLVLRFIAFKPGPIEYTSVSRGFASLKPTDYQYREMIFHGLTCEEILHVQVKGTRGCRMSDFEKHSATAEGCISRVMVEKSDLVTIFK